MTVYDRWHKSRPLAQATLVCPDHKKAHGFRSW